MRFNLRFDGKRQVNRHLIPIEVGVEPLAHQGVDLDGVALDQHRLERLDPHPMQRRRTVEQHRMLINHLFQDVPDRLVATFQHLLGRLDGVLQSPVLELTNDKRLIQLQGDLLGQSTLMQFQFRPHNHDRTRRVIHTLAQQVFAEAPLLALNHVGHGLQRTITRAEHRPPAATVVKQGVHRLLEHPLFVLNDDFRRVQVHELLKAAVAVDDAPIQVV